PLGRVPAARPDRPVLRDRSPHQGGHRPPGRGAPGGARVIEARPTTSLPRHHGARWNEPIIMELGQPGERALYPPRTEPEVAAAVGQPEIPVGVRRGRPP